MNVNQDTKSPFFSQKWDRMIGKSTMQKAISNNKKAQQWYTHIESTIAQDHARLINCKLREGFEQLKQSDFHDTKGFAEYKKSSLTLRKFFKTRDTLEFYIQNDVTQHKNRDSQLSAFRRWVSVAELLLKKNCYEGFFLVIAKAISIDIDYHFYKELPKICQSKFDAFNDLISPIDNYAALRKYIADNKQDHDFIPVFLQSKDLTMFNQILGDKQHLSSKELPVGDALLNSCLRKEKIIREIMASMGKEPSVLPEHLATAYNLIQKRYKKLDSENESQVVKPYKLPVHINHSTLYSKKILPSFWSRGCTSDKYWNKVFSIDNGIKPQAQH